MYGMYGTTTIVFVWLCCCLCVLTLKVIDLTPANKTDMSAACLDLVDDLIQHLLVLTDDLLNLEFTVTSLTDTAQMGRLAQVLNFAKESICLKFQQSTDAQLLRTALDELKTRQQLSVFSQRTEESSASQYFQFYGYLSQQQNMMQDFVRTSTYQKAILGNTVDFHVSTFAFHLIWTG